MNKNGPSQINSNNDSDDARLGHPGVAHVDFQKSGISSNVTSFFNKALDAAPRWAVSFIVLCFVLVVGLIVTRENTSRNLGLILIGISVVVFGGFFWHLRYTELKLQHERQTLEEIDELKKALRLTVAQKEWLEQLFEKEHKKNKGKTAGVG